MGVGAEPLVVDNQVWPPTDLVGTDMGPSRRTTGARIGGRSERVVAAVLHAVLAEVARVGYVGLRLEDVAASAAVAKTTIYRRWRTKAELVEAAIHELGRYDDPLPDTGSLREDLLELLERTMQMVATPQGHGMARLVTAETSDPSVDRLCRDLKDTARKHRARVIVRAQKRGDLPKTSDPMLILDFVFGVVMSRLVRGEKVDRATCERIVDFVVTGAEHGGGQCSRPQPRRS